MCYFNGSLSEGPFKAKEDIECWKIMDLCHGKLYSSLMSAGPYDIGDTIKCAKRLFKFDWLNARLLNFRAFFNGEVVHAYKFKPCFYGWASRVIVKCIIPKGTYYWYSSTEIVATEMRIVALDPYQ